MEDENFRSNGNLSSLFTVDELGKLLVIGVGGESESLTREVATSLGVIPRTYPIAAVFDPAGELIGYVAGSKDATWVSPLCKASPEALSAALHSARLEAMKKLRALKLKGQIPPPDDLRGLTVVITVSTNINPDELVGMLELIAGDGAPKIIAVTEDIHAAVESVLRIHCDRIVHWRGAAGTPPK